MLRSKTHNIISVHKTNEVDVRIINKTPNLNLKLIAINILIKIEITINQL